MSHKINPSSIDHSQQEEGGWAEYYPKLQRYCRFLTENAWDGDDIAQETYVKALKYNEQQITSALLNKIAYHHWLDMLRKRKNETIGDVPELNQHVLPIQLDDINHSVDLVLNHLTPKQAVTFVLKEAFQYQLREIASLLNTTEAAVKASIHRARKRLETEEEQSFSIESFWDEDEREQLSNIFYEALKNEDPAILIQSIPTITSISTMPKLNAKLPAIQNYTPSSTLCMAA